MRGGKIRALAVMSLTRSPVLPDVPTVAELGYKDFSMTIFYGVLAPANAPPTMVKRLNVDFNKILRQPEVQSSLQSQGFTTDPISPEEFSALIASDIKKARQIIDRAGIKTK